MKETGITKALLSGCLLTAVVCGANAQTLTYQPVNPAFGGNYLNYSWMISSATAQNRLIDPRTAANARATTQTSSLTTFSESLQRQLLSRITRQVVDQQFGEDTLEEGTFQFGDFTVEITNQDDGIFIRIVDGKGGETSLLVPYF